MNPSACRTSPRARASAALACNPYRGIMTAKADSVHKGSAHPQHSATIPQESVIAAARRMPLSTLYTLFRMGREDRSPHVVARGNAFVVRCMGALLHAQTTTRPQHAVRVVEGAPPLQHNEAHIVRVLRCAR